MHSALNLPPYLIYGGRPKSLRRRVSPGSSVSGRVPRIGFGRTGPACDLSGFFQVTLAFDPERLRSRLPFFRDLDKSDPNVWVHRKRDNLEAYVGRRGATVKVAFFGGMENLKRVQDPRYPIGSRVQVASLVDLAGMKMRVIQMRGSWKDYVDIHALVSHGVDVPNALAAAQAIDSRFNPVTSIRALQFYGDGNLNRVPLEMQQDLTRWAQAVDLAELPNLSSRRGLAPEGLSR